MLFESPTPHEWATGLCATITASVIIHHSQNRSFYSKITMVGNAVPYCTVNCICTYTEVTALLLWSSSAVTTEYLHSYSVGVPVWYSKVTVELLQRNSAVTPV